MNASIHTAQVLPARAVLFLSIVALHVLLAYLFASGLITQTIKILVPQTFDVVPLDPEPPAKTLEPLPSTAPPLIIASVVPPDPSLPPINMDSDVAITLPMAPDAGPGPVVVPDPAPLPIRLVGRNVMPNTADYYPPRDVRDGNEGTAEIRSCVSPSGKLEGSPTVEATSGRASLDTAAVRLARDGKYARAMQGDTPVPNCYRFRVTFTMH